MNRDMDKKLFIVAIGGAYIVQFAYSFYQAVTWDMNTSVAIKLLAYVLPMLLFFAISLWYGRGFNGTTNWLFRSLLLTEATTAVWQTLLLLEQFIVQAVFSTGTVAQNSNLLLMASVIPTVIIEVVAIYWLRSSKR